ncbi:MAG: Long-chain-fatty-acid--CoA ligase FadD17 [Steroidobacteraceae bacterium]|nr:Long-chain-fatty-acid--CoA ligase FadD17 [Steroidobacteraceae bacterium]
MNAQVKQSLNGQEKVVSREETQAKINRFYAAVAAPLPRPNWTVMDAFESVVQCQPEHDCLIYEDRKLSFRELDTLAACYAALALELELRAGDVAAVMVENRPEFFAAWMGLAKIGVTAALVNTQARKQALEHAVRETRSRVLLIGAECLEQLLETQVPGSGLEVFVIPDGAKALPPLSAGLADITPRLERVTPLADAAGHRQSIRSEDPCFLIFTSGTTGLPKAARVSHRRFLGIGRGWKAAAELEPDDVFYCVLPLFHGAALMSLYSTAIATGGTTVVRRKFSTSRFWEDVGKYQVTVFQYVGEVCRYLINTPVQPGEDQHTLKVMLGSGMGIDVWQQFTRRFGSRIRIFEGWGATESNGNMTNYDNRPGSCGRIPFRELSHLRLVRFDPQTESHPRDDRERMIECAVGEVGEIICQISKADGTIVSPFEGYTDAEESQKKVIADCFEPGDRWWRSGDLFRRDADDYFYFMDRIGDTFRWKAENVSTTEVTQQLSTAYPEIEILNVYGVNVPGHGGQAGMAAVVMKAGHEFDPIRMYAIATEQLSHYAVPLFVRVASQAQLTANFKLRKVDLRAQGFDRSRVADPLYALSHAQRRYVPLDDAALAELGIPT